MLCESGDVVDPELMPSGSTPPEDLTHHKYHRQLTGQKNTRNVVTKSENAYSRPYVDVVASSPRTATVRVTTGNADTSAEGSSQSGSRRALDVQNTEKATSHTDTVVKFKQWWISLQRVTGVQITATTTWKGRVARISYAEIDARITCCAPSTRQVEWRETWKAQPLGVLEETKPAEETQEEVEGWSWR